MKRIRGFIVEPYDPEAEEWEEDDNVVLDYGYASVHSGEDLDVKAYSCPRCKRVLFVADVSLHGVIFIRCRRCRRDVAIETNPSMRQIGFIDRLHRKES